MALPATGRVERDLYERIAPRITANGEAAVQGVVQKSQNVSFSHREPVQIRS